LGIGQPPDVEFNGLTTPDPVLLQRQLRRFVDAGLKACAMEASSVGIVERRLDGTHIRVAIFTNFSQDHLDYHGTMEAYGATKAQLFAWPSVRAAVINIDDDFGAMLADQMRGLRLDYLGFDDSMMVLLRKLASEPYGMFLVTGPTGSGKTTTLYAAISEINSGRDKIITIEDPVEYGLPGVLQIPVNEKKGLTFARGLRSILRHDPDKIMVGEIRDAETAQIAIQSALTGHLVFTTVHANNVFDVLGRFTHMGVDPYSFVSALNAVLAQRLVRVNCPHCAAIDKPSDALLADSGLSRAETAEWGFRAGRGCGQCRGTGYKGRKAIAEVLQLNDEIRELIVARAPIRAIKDAAVRNGLQFLRGSALELVKRGDTTLSEINRVTFVD
jgi:general secretion pathway protein E